MMCRSRCLVTAGIGRVPLFLPYLIGGESPHDDPYIRTEASGFEDRADTLNICHSFIDALACPFDDAMDSLEWQIRNDPCLLAIGGGAGTDLLLEAISDTIGMKLEKVSNAGDCTAIGAASPTVAGTGAGRSRNWRTAT